MQWSGRTPSKKCTTGTESAVQSGRIRVASGGGGRAPEGRQVGSLSPAVKEAQRLQNKTEKESENIHGNSIRFLSFFFFLWPHPLG